MTWLTCACGARKLLANIAKEKLYRLGLMPWKCSHCGNLQPQPKNNISPKLERSGAALRAKISDKK